MILFVSTGLLYFILILFAEHVLWLDTFWRGILFWFFVMVEIVLFLAFIIFPLFKLTKLVKGLDRTEASRMIGSHFPEVNDKLLNIIQLTKESGQTDLLLAGIEQKSRQLQPISFSSAIDFRDNLKFLKYSAVPAMIVLFVFYSGNFSSFAESLDRVVNYKTEFERPAPFSFVILNDGMEVRENEAFNVKIKTEGNVIPEEVSISYNNQSYFLRSSAPGIFEHSFEALSEKVEFYLSGNGVTSGLHTIEVLEVPRILDFEMYLDYPDYTQLKDESRDGSGDATIPEGTEVKWKLKTAATDEVRFIRTDTIEGFEKEEDEFSLKKMVYKNMSYQVSTSNKKVKEYEKLDFSLRITKDQYPVLDLTSRRDTTGMESWHFHGKVSDDYGVHKVNLVYYVTEKPDQLKVVKISDPVGAVSEFLSSFPDSLELKEGAGYEFYFQVFDNDMLRNGKSIKSEVFEYRKKSLKEIEDERVVHQGQALKELEEILKDLEFTEKELGEILMWQKEKGSLGFNDRKKLAGFIQRRQQQNEAMEKFSDKLRSGLEEGNKEDIDLREGLEERLESNERDRHEDDKLLEELEELSEKIEQEGLGEKLEQLSKSKRNQQRSLKQLLELTKKYYLEQRLQKTARKLEDLSREQDDISERSEGNQGGQDSLINEFKIIRANLDVLEEENSELKRPLSIGRDRTREDEIEEKQKNAVEYLEKGKEEDAGRSQRKAAEKMREMSGRMKNQGMRGSMEMMIEDSEALRQILDNLIVFSFEQEALLEDFKSGGENGLAFGEKLRKQNILKEHFEHVDDSLYALGMRNPMVNEDITALLTEVTYDLEKSLERFAQNRLSQGMGSQQYVVTRANELALMLSQILANMQDMMNPGSGSDGGKGDMQLSDIIKKQEELNKEMIEGMKGQNQEKEDGNQDGNEEKSGELFKIFKEQQILREALEDELKKNGSGEDGKEVEREMEQLEEDLLNEGFKRQNLERMIQIEQKLLDMEESEMRKELKQERESLTNEKDHRNSTNNEIPRVEEYFEMNEILNRQILPLRQIFKRKVQEYFEQRDD